MAYDLKRILGYIVLGVSLYFLRSVLPFNAGWQNPLLLSASLLALYLLVVFLFEKSLLKKPIQSRVI